MHPGKSLMSSCKQVECIYEAFQRLCPGILLMTHNEEDGNLESICKNKAAVLLCTDIIATRGLDFSGVHWVVQLSCPEDANTCRGVAATTAGTAMAVPVFVGTKKQKIILRAAAYESFSLVKPDSHMHARTRARTTIKVQSSNLEHVLAAESRKWLSTASRLPEVGEVLHQLQRHIFPGCQFGKSEVVSRAVQGSLFGTF